MRFTKMQGAGNSYVYVDCFRDEAPADPARVAINVSRPHFGIGSDGLILIEPSDVADARMRMFNADGSEGIMCGNGVRCVGKYLYDAGIARRETVFVETRAGIKALQMIVEGGVAAGARVDMGEPVLTPEKIPALFGSDPVIGKPIRAAEADFLMTCVSMGNPHAVLIVPELPDDGLFYRAGRELETHPLFPERANVEFVKVEDRGKIRVRVWERGSGETLACGTGACASLIACALGGVTDRAARVILPGGELYVEWKGDGRVYMTGSAVTVFTGEIDIVNN